MGRGRGRIVASGCVLGTVALLAIGCGAQEHANEPRPQPPTRVSVTLTPRAITMQPPRIAIGPEPSQQIPQNQHAGQPPVRSNAPLNVVFVTANLTNSDSKLELRGPKTAISGPLVANGNGSFQASLPTGAYMVRAAGIPGAQPVRFAIGPYRSSSQNDVLLP
jgi:hypothetical protein